VFAVVAEDTASGEAIGCAFLLGDRHSCYYVKDVVVYPAWQAKRVGTALMQALTDWLEANAADKAMVGLFTGEMLEPFYEQFGFTKAFGMTRYIKRNGSGS
jgi:GNAT superfamily N-acetyltransferase